MLQTGVDGKALEPWEVANLHKYWPRFVTSVHSHHEEEERKFQHSDASCNIAQCLQVFVKYCLQGVSQYQAWPVYYITPLSPDC